MDWCAEEEGLLVYSERPGAGTPYVFVPIPRVVVWPHVPLTAARQLCYTANMQAKQAGSLNLRNIPYAVIQRAKMAALREGKTLRQWILDAIVEKARGTK